MMQGLLSMTRNELSENFIKSIQVPTLARPSTALVQVLEIKSIKRGTDFIYLLKIMDNEETSNFFSVNSSVSRMIQDRTLRPKQVIRIISYEVVELMPSGNNVVIILKYEKVSDDISQIYREKRELMRSLVPARKIPVAVIDNGASTSKESHLNGPMSMSLSTASPVVDNGACTSKESHLNGPMSLSTASPVVDNGADEGSVKLRIGGKRAAVVPTVATIFKVKKVSNLGLTSASSNAISALGLTSASSNAISALCLVTNLSMRVPLNVMPMGFYRMTKAPKPGAGSSKKIHDDDEQFIYVNVRDLSGEIDLKFASKFEVIVRRNLIVGSPSVIRQYTVQGRKQKIGAVSRHDYILAVTDVSEENLSAGQDLDVKLSWIDLYELDWNERVLYNVCGFIKQIFDNRNNMPGHSTNNKAILSFVKDEATHVRDVQIYFNGPTRGIIIPFKEGMKVWVSHLTVTSFGKSSVNVKVLATKVVLFL